MNDQKRRALEAAGWVTGDAGDFLGLTDEERCLVGLRANLSKLVIGLRESQGLTRQQLARMLHEKASHVAGIETGGAGVSLDSMFLALFKLGGSVQQLASEMTVSSSEPRFVQGHAVQVTRSHSLTKSVRKKSG